MRRATWACAVLALLSLVATACGAPSTPSANTGSLPTQALLQRALTAQRQGQYAVASADYLAVLDRQPANSLAWYDLGVISSRDGSVAGAAHDYEEAVAANPKYVPALYNLAVLLARSQPSRAMALYQKVLSVQPGDASARYNYGLLLQAAGRAAAGQAEINRAITMQPSLGS